MTQQRILIVDDHHDICASMRDILEDQGFQVDVAHCGEDAILLAKQHDPRLVVLDYQMPGMNGVQLFAELKGLAPKIVGFLVTAYAGGSGAQDAIKNGIRAVIQKPIDVPQFLKAIRNEGIR